MRLLLSILVCFGTQTLRAGDGSTAPSSPQVNPEIAPPQIQQRVISSVEWASLIPTEKTLLETYQNLTPEDLKDLLPSERASANSTKGAAIAAAYAAELKQWCEKYPAKCAQLVKAGEAEEARIAEERANRQEAQRRRNQQVDRDQAGQLIDRVKSATFMGRSRDEIKTDLSLSGSGGPETQRVKSQIETNLFMGNPILQGVHNP
jgi:hypothetical protein